uniref:Uncharacterized protein n=1 Tax=Strombidium rassoulzadegani TaxID=1082188 RepID=A0A7S3FXI4_9SPIT|mmetsp:Transcript_1738/g.3069  ORF Transcript_1738/g.3069 Transcript_1738/m.3069 type:complete len:111 (+) Transcript_1738:395-727(+)
MGEGGDQQSAVDQIQKLEILMRKLKKGVMIGGKVPVGDRIASTEEALHKVMENDKQIKKAFEYISGLDKGVEKEEEGEKFTHEQKEKALDFTKKMSYELINLSKQIADLK